jgi:phage tail-like protein
MLPIPSINYIPKIYRDANQSEMIALTNKIDDYVEYLFSDAMGLTDLLDPDKCPSNFLNNLGDYINAGILNSDSETTKRIKIYEAVATHKKRGSWVNHVKIIIDAITGYDARIFRGTDFDDWILCGDGVIEAGSSFAILGGDGTAPYGMLLVGDGTEVVVKGNVYVDCHYGIYTAVLTAGQIAELILQLQNDIVPAYMNVYLGYIDAGGAFALYTVVS